MGIEFYLQLGKEYGMPRDEVEALKKGAVGVEFYIKVAERYGMSEKKTAYFLLDCAKKAVGKVKYLNRHNGNKAKEEMRSLNSDSLECRIIAAFMFEGLGMTKEMATALELAGNSAFFVNAPRLDASLKVMAAKNYEKVGYDISAGYSLIRAAGALLSKKNSEEYFDKIGSLIDTGMDIIMSNGKSTNTWRIRNIRDDYSRLSQKMTEQKELGREIPQKKLF